MIIEMGKKYKRRSSGKQVRILCIDRPHEYPVVAMDEDGVNITTHMQGGGFWASGPTCDNDLIEALPYEDFKIDDPVWVKYKGFGKEYKRHFAGVTKQGGPTVFSEGRSSWTTEVGIDVVESIRRPDGTDKT